jgi:hypothetical protein
MPHINTPILDFFNIFKKNFLFVIGIFLISIFGSYYYNNHFKTVVYKYSLTFDVVSEWKTSQLDINYKEVLSLTRSSILNLIKDFKPMDYSIELEDKYNLYFEMTKPVKVENFIDKVNIKINQGIKEVLDQKIKILKNRDFANQKNLESQINDLIIYQSEFKTKIKTKQAAKIEKITAELEISKISEKLMIDQFGYLINIDLGLPLESTNKYIGMGQIIELKKEYSLLLKSIILQEQELKKLKDIKFNLEDSNKLGTDIYTEYETYELNKIDQDISNLRKKISSNSIREELIQYNSNYVNFITNPYSSFYSINEWIINDNSSSNKEIIAAGIFFGILLNVFFLFLTSDYLRKSLEE